MKEKDDVSKLITDIDNLLFDYGYSKKGLPDVDQTGNLYAHIRAEILAYTTKQKIKWLKENQL